MTRDLATGLVCLATSLILLALTLGLPGPSLLVPIGPGFYPRIILGITALLSAVLVVQALLARRRERSIRGSAAAPKSAPATAPLSERGRQLDAPGSGARPNYGLVAWSFAVFGVYVALLPLFGFRVATLAFVVALQWLLGRPRTTRAWLTAFVIGLVSAFGVFHLFQDYLSVLLPRGRWTGF